jgi:TetR/AcrR family fatty acid metabolism transcriptional regulator
MRSAADRQQKSTRILQAAMHVFALKGFKSAALEEVAREAGIAKGTLYLYFRDKQELYFKAVLQVFDELEAHVAATASQEAGPLDKLRAVARGQLEFFSRHRDALRLVAGMPAPSLAGLRKRLFGELQERRQRVLQAVTGIMEEARRQGLVRGDIETRDLVLSYVGTVSQAGQELVMQAAGEAGACCPAGAGSLPKSRAAVRADVIMKILIEGIAPVGSRGGDKR